MGLRPDQRSRVGHGQSGLAVLVHLPARSAERLHAAAEPRSVRLLQRSGIHRRRTTSRSARSRRSVHDQPNLRQSLPVRSRDVEIAHAMADQTSGDRASPLPVPDPHDGHQRLRSGLRLSPGGQRRSSIGSKNALSVQCLPQKLTVDATTGSVPCLILVTLAQPGNAAASYCTAIWLGLIRPPTILAQFQASSSTSTTGLVWRQDGPGATDPLTLTTCQLNELSIAAEPAKLPERAGLLGIDAARLVLRRRAAARGRTCSARHILFTASEPAAAGAAIAPVPQNRQRPRDR